MSEITTNGEKGASDKTHLMWIALFALVVFVYLFGLNIPLVGPDEPRYAQVAREMMDRGDWITPTLGGANWFEKPALLYWLEMVAYKLFGVSEFAARLGPALFGLGTIAALWLLGRSARFSSANWLALMAASTLGLIVFSRGASFDIIITFPITAALVSFYIWQSGNEKAASGENARSSAAYMVSFYFFVGVALLAKGLIGIVFPFGIVGLYFLISRRFPTRAYLFSLLLGTLLSLIVASIWYVPMYMAHGYTFIDEFIIQQHFQRFTSNKYQHPQPFFYFFIVLPIMMIPWMPFLFAPVLASARRLFSAITAPASSSGSLSRFAMAWLLVPLVFFSFSGSKLPGYILPAVPAAIILAWNYLVPRLDKSRNWQWIVATTGASVLMLCVVLLLSVVPRYADADSVKGLIAAANDRGKTTEKVISYFTLSHNAEFYAAGRLVRDEAGRQRRLFTPAEVKAVIDAENGSPVLVLVPLEHLASLTQTDILSSEIIADNSDLAIVLAAAK